MYMFDDEFDFEHWAYMAANDPERFERERQALLDNVINTAPEAHRARLRAVQNRVELMRQKYDGNPTGCATAMYMEMMRSVGQLNKALHGDEVFDTKSSADVIDFKPGR